MGVTPPLSQAESEAFQVSQSCSQDSALSLSVAVGCLIATLSLTSPPLYVLLYDFLKNLRPVNCYLSCPYFPSWVYSCCSLYWTKLCILSSVCGCVSPAISPLPSLVHPVHQHSLSDSVQVWLVEALS